MHVVVSVSSLGCFDVLRVVECDCNGIKRRVYQQEVSE